jgi:glutamate dehydrogenase
MIRNDSEGNGDRSEAAYLQAIRERGGDLQLDPEPPVDRARFLEHYYAQADAEDLARDPQMLAAAALSHLAWARVRQPATANLRVFNPTVERDGWTSEHTIVQAANDDMPFLVDSLTMNLNALGHAIHATTHPLLRVERNARGELTAVHFGKDGEAKTESFIHIEIVRETDPQLLSAIESTMHKTLADVRAAVEDWHAMLGKLHLATEELGKTPGLPGELLAESRAFLEWLAGNHFTLLGYREYALIDGDAADELKSRPGTGLGILRDDAVNSEVVRLAGRARDEARSQNPLVITKTTERSTVHRPAPLDHIGVKVFDASGQPRFERRFLGLFTSVAYNKSPRDIPLLRLKVQRLMEQSKLDPMSHRGKALQHILDTLPRDDLFQGSLEDLRRISAGTLGLQERHKLRLFCRKDIFGRFYSCLVYLPRDQYNTRARRAIETILLNGLSGTAVTSELTISESALARLAVTVRTPPGQLPEADVAALQRELENAVRTWTDRLREILLLQLPEDQALELLHSVGEHFSAAYQEEADVARASGDIGKMSRLQERASDLEMSLEPSSTLRDDRLRFTTFKRDEAIQLYIALPILENMGFKVIGERVYPIHLPANTIWIQDFELETTAAHPIEAETVDARLKECFARVLRGDAENDGFNGFVVSAGLDWREAVLVRAYCKYVLQTGIRFSQSYMQEVLGRYPRFCCALVQKTQGLFDVDLSAASRDRRLEEAETSIRQELDRAVSLDDDRILRAFASVVNAILRTNFFQREGGEPKTYISFKLDPIKVPELPKPRPKFEIFVYSQRIEGVHLRSSKVARGGIRWSDRREDFRTEVLGLMKAQQVKNTVIVPSGAKGGFVCKALPAGDREAIQREVIGCYRIFIRGLLDLTDNIVDGRIVAPERVIRHDDDDPYLVVAADKGTATFSDIANGLSAEFAFWLGDAFASGGSAGYDHKKMGITARGAWEAVQRHFRELNVDVRRESVTVIGIGDMSGDVFGNGMLLSEHLKLIAAFNHQHVFIDPDPDPARSFAERQRLFGLPRSSWDDYDRSALSNGGGIYSRQSKSIEITPAAQAALQIEQAQLTPPELIRAILAVEADLLWNGGIGTYVKAGAESHVEAGDPVNDAVRINGKELRCRVVGEGGNLGFTQLGRIEYAQGGGRINTDFIDNSGGVDSSDREVNIKILLNDAIRQRKLAPNQRDALLAGMTDEIAELVPGNNYAQTQALSMMDSRAPELLTEHARLIRVLEAQGLLDRTLEFLPSEEQIEERRAAGHGLTRPELAIILAYSKIELASSLVQTDIPEDPFLAAELEAYFPQQLSKRFKKLIPGHRLAREIIAMLIGGSMINRMGPFFVLRAEEETGANVAQVARAYAIVREVFGVRTLWRHIEALDYRVPAGAQYDSIFQISRMVRRAVYWFLQNYVDELDIASMVTRFRPGVRQVFEALPKVVTGRTEQRFAQDALELKDMGLPEALVNQIASLNMLTQVLDIIELAREFGLAAKEVGQVYFELAKELRLDWIREQIEGLKVQGRWRAMARATLRETLAQEQRALLRSALGGGRGRDPHEALAAWLTRSAPKVERVQRVLDDIQAADQIDFAILSVALKEVARLA